MRKEKQAARDSSGEPIHWRKIILAGAAVAVVLMCVFLLVGSRMSAQPPSTGGSYFTQAGITIDGEAPRVDLPASVSSCVIYGTFDGASVAIWTDIQETADSMRILSTSAPTGLFGLDHGPGRYFVVITGAGPSTDVTFHCRWRS